MSENQGPFAYPGPFGPYERDSVTVAAVQVRQDLDGAVTLRRMKECIPDVAARGADIVVFGEMLLNLAEPIPGPASLEMAELAIEHGLYIAYGTTERHSGDEYNAVAVVGPQGVLGSYRKLSPGPLEVQARGHYPVAFQSPWGPIGVSICYDTYYWGEIARTYALMGSRLILNPTGVFDWPGLVSIMHETTTVRVRENFLFIASANRIDPREPTFQYVGESTIKGPYEVLPIGLPSGDVEIFARAGSGEETIVATLDLGRSDRNRAASFFFQPNPQPGYHGEPEFLPQTWANLWGANWREYADRVLLK